jgi:hypothetical protein
MFFAISVEKYLRIVNINLTIAVYQLFIFAPITDYHFFNY